MLLVAALLASAAHAEDLTVVVEKDVTHVVLQCDRDRYDKSVEEGTKRPNGSHVLAFPIRPGRQCDVTVTRSIGRVEQLGEWECTAAGCKQLNPSGPAETLPDGTVKLTVAELPAHGSLELNCPNGYRKRVAVTDDQALFEDVPNEECTVHFKGGAPLKYRPIRWGAYTCRVVSGTAVCTPR